MRVEAVVAAGQTVAAAHGHWHEAYLAQVAGVAPFARQHVDAITPGSLVRVTCECVQEPTPNMSSYYGFRGHFVSLLVSVDAEAIWDARVEPAS